jgi:hypothetical protein
MRRSLTAILLLIAVSAASCASISRSGAGDDKYKISEISLEKSGGMCCLQGREGFIVVLRSDGAATYQGFVGAKRNGKYHGKIQGELFTNLAKLINRNGFFSLKDEYANNSVADGYTLTTGVAYDGGRKAVRDYEKGGGDKLSEIEEAIQDAAEQIAWERDES